MLRSASIHLSLSLFLSLLIYLSLLSNPFRPCLVMVQEAPFPIALRTKAFVVESRKIPSFNRRSVDLSLFILVQIVSLFPLWILMLPTFPCIIYLLRLHTYAIERSIDVYFSPFTFLFFRQFSLLSNIPYIYIYIFL